MAITIGSNIASLRAQRRLAQNSGTLETVFERLSSGQRINRASDDAAGLAIAESLRNDSRVFNQGRRNLNDGISLLNIADGAVSQLTNITTRLVELAEQAANGVLGTVQRESLDEEAQALKDEYLRIIQSTEFNGQQILTSEFGELRLQAGYGVDGGIQSSLGGVVGTGGLETAKEITSGSETFGLATGDFNGDGFLDLATADRSDDVAVILLGDGNGGFSAPNSITVGSSPRSIQTGDLNGDGILDLVTADSADDTISVLIGDGSGGFSAATSFVTGSFPQDLVIADFTGDGILDVVTSGGLPGDIVTLVGDGNGSFSASATTTLGGIAQSITAGDFNNDGLLDVATTSLLGGSAAILLGDGSGGFTTSSGVTVGDSPYSIETADFNGDGILDLVTANSGDNNISVALGTGTGTFGTATSFDVGDGPNSVTTGDMNGDGIVDIIVGNATDNEVGILLGDGTGSFGATSTFGAAGDAQRVTTGDFNGDGVLDVVVADDGGGTANLLLGSTTSGTAPLLDFSLTSATDAKQALSQFKQKLDQLTQQRGEIGAFETRLNAANSVLGANVENYLAAESRIRDTDIADESSRLVRLNILQQATSAVLAQANQQPALALQLLGDN